MKINAKTFPIFVTVTLMGFSLCLNGCAPSEEKAGEAPSAESSETTENTEGAEETEETKKAKKAEKA
ncbi:MAG: hypothetical protein Q4C70_02475, partial [Planctomycetia bacterium]|nr:hypothetical protein [Planctomycetia bacterium]